MSQLRLTEEQFAELQKKRSVASESVSARMPAAAGPRKEGGPSGPPLPTPLAPKKRPSKFNAQRTETEDGVFDSKREAVRFASLKMLAKGREITGLARQVRFDLNEGGTYIADFVYLDRRTQKWVVEDSKGCRTPVYKRKAKLMRELYGIEILET
jgi:hypothetical protein